MKIMAWNNEIIMKRKMKNNNEIIMIMKIMKIMNSNDNGENNNENNK